MFLWTFGLVFKDRWCSFCGPRITECLLGCQLCFSSPLMCLSCSEVPHSWSHYPSPAGDSVNTVNCTDLHRQHAYDVSEVTGSRDVAAPTDPPHNKTPLASTLRRRGRRHSMPVIQVKEEWPVAQPLLGSSPHDIRNQHMNATGHSSSVWLFLPRRLLMLLVGARWPVVYAVASDMLGDHHGSSVRPNSHLTCRLCACGSRPWRSACDAAGGVISRAQNTDLVIRVRHDLGLLPRSVGFAPCVA